ncbi:hypothetical protein EJ06DRAFT_318815 [Trichodelitschia bisporula]|uniref:CCHC-type domain-containing protein n=1 Tax=Trichodelitschia bisporula TaxID=703511 RepID=A0A6G1I506_9PEZI|nr:hypothetical protein EJ06DRAFT_318815 [Trichodelitschia bisporula]
MATPRQLSSRVLTMKFMQRAAAQASPSSPDTLPSKRVRLSSGAAAPVTPSDIELVQAAVQAEELKRTQAIERQAADAGETKWVLTVRDPSPAAPLAHIVRTGFADIDAAGLDDSGDGDNDEQTAIGRQTFGKKPKKHVVSKSEDSESESGSDSSASDDEDEDDPTAQLIRESRKEADAQRRADSKARKRTLSTDSGRPTENRRYKEVKLSQLTSISGGGASVAPKRGKSQNKCFNCGQTGHQKSQCPRR